MIYLFSFLVSVAGAWGVLLFGERVGLSDCPTERSSHCIPTPKGGGLGILMVFSWLALHFNLNVLFWLPLLIVALVSLWGDLVHLPPIFRLTVQVFTAMVASYAFSNWVAVPFGKWVFILFVTFFIVSTANFYNFMDGIDGLAGITGFIGFALIVFFSYVEGNFVESSYMTLAGCMSIACLGFLVFNLPTAKVFLGDVGSILLGFLFACLVVIYSKDFLDFICFAACIFPFYADCLLTLIIRILDGEKLSQPHRRHLYQLLVNEMQIDHWKVTFGYGVFQVFAALCVMSIKSGGYYAVISALLLIFCVFSSVSVLLRRKCYRFSNN